MLPFKTVLIVVGVEPDDAELDRAADVAERLGARLIVLVTGVAPPPPSSPYGVVSSDLWASELRDGQGEAEARALAVAARLEPRGLPISVQAQYVDRATVSTLAARYARYADLTLAPPEKPDSDLRQAWVINGALFESGRPILLLPKGPIAFPEAKRVVIGWDASVEASKAVRDAIELMQAAEAVHAVLVDPVPSFDGHGPEPGADLAAYLGRHGVNVAVHRLPKEGKEAGEVLQRVALDLGADLLVMGGFGHSRLRERIFGGTTTRTIRETKVPVLMAH